MDRRDIRPRSPDGDDEQSRIEALNRVLDDISRRSDDKERRVNARDQKNNELRQELQMLRDRLIRERFSEKTKKEFEKRIKDLERSITASREFNIRTLDPVIQESQDAASYVLALWNSVESSEYSKLSEQDKGILEEILQNLLPQEASIYFSSLYRHLPAQQQEQKVKQEEAKNFSYLLHLARHDMAAYFGVRSDGDGRLDCDPWDTLQRMDQTNVTIVLLKLALKISVETSLQKVSIFDSVSSMIQIAAGAPVRTGAAMLSVGAAFAAAPHMAPLLTSVASSVGSGATAVVNSESTAAAIAAAMNYPGSSIAFVNYVIHYAPQLLESLKTYFGVPEDQIRSIFDKINDDFLTYQQRQVVGPIPDSILSFYDAIVFIYSLTANAIYSQSSFLAGSIRSIFKVPENVVKFFKKASSSIADGFQSLTRFLQGPDSPVPFEKRCRFHDRFRAEIMKLDARLQESLEATTRLMALSKSDERTTEAFEVRVNVHKAEDAKQHPYMYTESSDSLQAQVFSPPHDPVYLRDMDAMSGLSESRTMDIYDPAGVLLESNQKPELVSGVGTRLADFKHDVNSGVTGQKDTKDNGKGKGGGNRTRHRKATTKKQKSKKNKRQSRRKSHRSSSRRSRK